MKIEIYDPAMCCSTGVCGPGVDPELVRIYDALRQIQKQAPEVRIDRYGLTSDPQAFISNAVVTELLKSDGPECLPLGFIDGELVSKGSYPANDQLTASLIRNGHMVTLGGKKSCQAGCC
jgi:hypothetical protein